MASGFCGEFVPTLVREDLSGTRKFGWCARRWLVREASAKAGWVEHEALGRARGVG